MSIIRFGLGQNTPLTCVWASGFEFSDPDLDGFAGSSINYDSTSPHQKDGSGGSTYVNLPQLNFSKSQWFPSLREPVIAAAMRFYSHTGNNAEGPYITGDSPSTNLSEFTEHGGQFSLRATRNSTLRFIGGSGTDIESAASTLTPNKWHWIWWRTFIDTVNGELDVWIDDYSQNVISSTSINTNRNTAENYINFISVRLFSDNLTGAVDDIAVFARSMYYTSGAGGGGEPIAGNTLAGPSGTAIIDFVTDDGSGNGVVFVSQVSGSFAPADALNDGSGWTSTASNNLANDEASLTVPELYFIARWPTGDDVTTNWSSTAATHYTEINNTNDTQYIHTNTAGIVDELTTSGLLPAKAETEMLIFVSRGKHEGARNVSSYTLAYADGIGTISANTSFFTTDYISRHWIWTRNIRTADKFTASEINNLTVQITSIA